MIKLSDKNIAKGIFAALENKTGGDLRDAIQRTVWILAKKRVLVRQDGILKELSKLQDKKDKIVRAEVFTPKALSPHAKHALAQGIERRYGAKTAILEMKEDGDLLGGVKIEAEDELLDLSARGRIMELEKHLRI